MNITINDAILLFQGSVSIATFFLAAWTFLPELPPQLSYSGRMTILLLVHMFRQLGTTWLAPTVVPAAPPQWFGLSVGVGDFTCMLLAAAAIAALRRKSPLSHLLLWLFTVAGIVDFAIVGSLIVMVDAPSHLGAHWFVAACYVPLLFVSHVLVADALVRKRKSLVLISMSPSLALA